MGRLDEARAAFQKGLTDNADFFFPEAATFTKGPHRWEDTHFSVSDPEKVSRAAVAGAEAAAREFQVAYSDVRLLKVMPGDVRPPRGATVPWDGGTLELLAWSQAGKLSGQKVATCVLRR